MSNLEVKKNALALFQQQRFPQALELCERYCRKAKGDYEGYLILGLIQGAMQDYPAAVRSLARAAKLKPDQAPVHFNLGVAQWRGGALEVARESLARATRLNQGFFEAWFNLAEVCRELGRVDEALAHYSTAATINSAYVPVNLNMGNLLRLRGDLEGAIGHFRKAIELAPGYYEAHVSLGQTLFRQAQYDAAETAFRQAAVIAPDRAEACMELGLVAHRRHQLAEARGWLEKALGLDPRYALAHYNLAVVLVELEELDAAAAAFERAITLDQECLDAYMGLARIQRQLGALDQALQTLKRGGSCQPLSAQYHSEMGNLIAMLGDPTAALESHSRAVALAPDQANVYTNLAGMLVITNQYDAALCEYEKALTLADNDMDRQAALAGMARIHERRGHYEQAYSLLEPCMENIVNPSVALAFGMLAPRLGMSDRALVCMEAALNEPAIYLEAKIDLHFQLGKICDKLKDYDQAFSHYVTGNRFFAERNSDLIRRYRPEDDAAYFERLRAWFTEEFFAKTPVSGCMSERPLFVVGMPRSGTTLTESILCGHPDIHGAGELSDIAHLRKEAEARTGLDFPDALSHLPVPELDELAERYLAALRDRNATTRHVVDKMPHNFLYLGLIALLFPKARIIHIRRDPIDNCLSIFFQKFNIGHAYANDLAWLGHYYRLYEDLMAHWNRVLPLSILNIRYEDLVADQVAVTRRMIEFSGLDWDEACLAFHARQRDVATPSYDQVNRPVYRDSAGRWKNYQAHIGPLIDSLRQQGVLEDARD
ncbi:MAG TPA: sulfotransferase [Marinobacter sp.]